MTVIPKIKRFSRSKVIDESIEQIPEQIEILEGETEKNGKFQCECGAYVARKNMTRHIKTMNHVNYINSKNDYEPDSPIELEEPEEDNIDYNYQPEDDNFLEELNNINYKEEVKEKPKNEKPIYYKSDAELLLELELNNKPKKQKAQRQQPMRSLFEDNDSIFGDVPTEILGRDKRELLTKITQYKNLFPTELKKFTIKKNANTQELQTALDEMEAIVDCSSLENFLTDSIL